MALTKVGKEGITGISNSSDATAITIDSSERVGIDFTPKTQHANVTSSLNVGGGSTFQRTKDTYRTSNFYYNSSDTGKSIDTGYALMYSQDVTNGKHAFTTSTSSAGSADATVSLQQLMVIDANGHVTMPKQSAFLVSKASGGAQSFNASATTTITWSDEHFDNNADFASNTFTAPVTGKYQFNVNIRIDVADEGADYYQIEAITSNRTYYHLFSTNGFSQNLSYMNMNMSLLADLDASDTCYIRIYQAGGANQSDVDGQTITTNFSGYLAC